MYSIENIGKVILEKRRALGMTQETLAERLHVSPQAVSKWECGSGYPDLTLLPAILRELELSPGEMLGEPAAETFPPSVRGMTLLFAEGELALYADPGKKLLKRRDKTFFFEDGSEADFVTRTVINRGKGEICFLSPEKLPGQEEKTQTRALRGGKIHSLELRTSGSCQTEIVSGEKAGEYAVFLDGSEKFLREVKVHEKNGTLHIETPTLKGRNSSEGERKIRVVCGFAAGKRLSCTIDGSGSLRGEPKFEEGELTIAGSGEIRLSDVGRIKASISGSGEVQLGDGESLTATIAGSGEVTAGRWQTFCGSIAGAGGIAVKEAAASCKGSIAGSGEITVGKCRDGSFHIAGSGEITSLACSGSLSFAVNGSGGGKFEGDVERLTLKIAGAGSVDGKALSVGDAEIDLSGRTDAEIGHIRGSSVERLRKGATLRVLRRGT